MKLTLTKLLVAAVLAVIVAVASLEVIDAGAVGGTREFGALADAAITFVNGVGAVDDTVTAVLGWLAASIIATESAF